MMELFASHVYPGLNNIQVIDLSDNLIQQIQDSHFIHNYDLKVLFLSHNNLTNLSKESFNGLTNVRNLTLDNNNLSVVTEDAFQYVKQLRHLDLKNNIITSRNLNLWTLISFNIFIDVYGKSYVICSTP
jgi:Leucine-rich repeat (LRR) protein